MISNADKLKALRYTLGLSQAEMAEKIGVSEASVTLCENGYTPLGKVKAPAQNKIKAFLEVQDISSAVVAESKLVMEFEERQKSLYKQFTEGKCYRIYDGKDKSRDCDYILMFLHNEGIHHVFREIRGGCTTTYTDAQLVGKKIKEVEL